MNIQFKKGVLELCVLSILSQKDCYGYDIVHNISESVKVSGGTIYPMLRRLIKEGYFTTYVQSSNEGPSRKYYHLTELGHQKKVDLEKEWGRLVGGVNHLIEGSDAKCLEKNS